MNSLIFLNSLQFSQNFFTFSKINVFLIQGYSFFIFEALIFFCRKKNQKRKKRILSLFTYSVCDEKVKIHIDSEKLRNSLKTNNKIHGKVTR